MKIRERPFSILTVGEQDFDLICRVLETIGVNPEEALENADLCITSLEGLGNLPAKVDTIVLIAPGNRKPTPEQHSRLKAKLHLEQTRVVYELNEDNAMEFLAPLFLAIEIEDKQP